MSLTQHKDLIRKWDLGIDDDAYDRLLNGVIHEDDKHKMLQLWRKINAGNMIYSLGSRRHPKTAEQHFPTEINMPARLPELLHEHGMIEHPLRLANTVLLNNITTKIALSPLLGHGNQNVIQTGYVTVSHVWADGKMDTKAPICRNALVDLGAKYIWMDKICIRQKEPGEVKDEVKDEIKAEIPRLKDYYKVAPLCLLAVTASGRSIVEMDDAVTELWKFHEIIQHQGKSNSRLSHSTMSAYTERMDTLIGQLARNGVLHHQWFTRIWTLPEMSVTQDLVVSNGREYVYMTPLIKLIGKYGRIKSREMFMEEGIVACFDALRMTGGYAPFTLAEAMESSVGRTSGSEGDKIYALMGMVPSISGLLMDYDIGMNEILFASCRLAYNSGDEDVSWMLCTGDTDKGLPKYGARFLCPLPNDNLWLNREYVTVTDSDVQILGSSHIIETWAHIHDARFICNDETKDLKSEVMLWSNLLVHTSSDIRDFVKFAAWIGTSVVSGFSMVLVVVFSMSKPESGLSVVIPSCVENGIVTTPVICNGKRAHIGRSVIVGDKFTREHKRVSFT